MRKLGRTPRDRARAAADLAEAERLREMAEDHPDERVRRASARAAKAIESHHRRFGTYPGDLLTYSWLFVLAILPMPVLADVGYPELGVVATVIAGTGIVVARRRWERAHPFEDPDSADPPG